ncbi:MAG: AMP-binding protein [Desulfomonilaceae bacterium]
MISDEKPWLKSYDLGVQAEIEIPNLSIKAHFVDTFKEFSERPALHYMGMTMTFGELLEKSGRFAKALNDRGLSKGDLVAIHMPNTPQYLIAIVGSLRAGCAVSGVSPLSSPDEMAYQINDCGARVIVALDLLFFAKIAAISDRLPKLELILVTGFADMLPITTEYPAGTPLARKEVMSFMSFLASASADVPDIAVSSDDTCYVQYTGGTTGRPKGAELLHSHIMANMLQLDHWNQSLIRGQEIYLSAFPMFHQAGLIVANGAMAFGYAQVLIPDPRNLPYIVKAISALKPTVICNVPSLTLMLLADPEFKKLDFSSLKVWISGASPFPVDAIRALESVIGEGKFVEVWGMTETSPVITANPAKGKKKPGSVGLPLPGTRVHVVDPADGVTPVPVGKEGELVASGPQVMKGYWNQPKETEIALRIHDGSPWMHTGDVGSIDEDGYVYIVDRVKDMIIVGGFKVFSIEVEDRFYKHPAVGMCAAIGLPNPERPDSEIVKLFVQKSPGYKDKPNGEIETELIAYARNKMAPYKVPKVVEFVEAMPLTSVGKVDKKLLRKR